MPSDALGWILPGLLFQGCRELLTERIKVVRGKAPEELAIGVPAATRTNGLPDPRFADSLGGLYGQQQILDLESHPDLPG